MLVPQCHLVIVDYSLMFVQTENHHVQPSPNCQFGKTEVQITAYTHTINNRNYYILQEVLILFSHRPGGGETTNCNIRAQTCHYPTQTTTTACSFHTYFHTHYNVSNMLHDALNRQKHLPLSTSFMQHVHLELHYRHKLLPPPGSLLPTPIGSTHHLCMKLIHVPTEHTLQYYKIKCRDGNVCEAYVIPFLFGTFFTVCHPYIVVQFLKCFFCDFIFRFQSVGNPVEKQQKGTIQIHITGGNHWVTSVCSGNVCEGL